MSEIRFEDRPSYNVGNTELFNKEEFAIIERAMQIMDAKAKSTERMVLSDPGNVARYLRTCVAGLEYEVFGILFLDNRHRLIDNKHMFRGTIDGAAVPPREVVKESLNHNAAAVILYHNHPSGVAEPSRSDRNITNRLKDALSLVDIRVLDHFVIGEESVVSFAERGWC